MSTVFYGYSQEEILPSIAMAPMAVFTVVVYL